MPLITTRIKDFSGGRNTAASAHDLAPNESPNDLNIDLATVGSVKKRAGITRWFPASLGPYPVTSLYRYYKQDRSKYLMALCGPKLWAISGQPPDALGSIISTDRTINTFMTFATMQDWLWFANYDDDTQRWDGTTIRPAFLYPPIASPLTAAGWEGTGDDVSLGGDMAAGEYIYTFTAVYGGLGRSNRPAIYSTTSYPIEPDLLLPWVTFSGFHIATVANGGYTMDDVYGLVGGLPETPTHVEIWRTTVNPVYESEREIVNLPFYLIERVPIATLVADPSYGDVKNDLELQSLYPGDHYYPPRARYIAEHRNRLFYANTQERNDPINPGTEDTNPSRVWFSDLYQPSRIVGFIDVFPEDGDEITGIVSLHNNLVVFKNQKTYMLLGVSEADFEIRLANGSVGCVAPRSIAMLDNVVMFRGMDGRYGFDGGSFQRLTNKIRPDILAMPQEGLEFASGGSWKGRYYAGEREAT